MVPKGPEAGRSVQLSVPRAASRPLALRDPDGPIGRDAAAGGTVLAAKGQNGNQINNSGSTGPAL